jgi:hypothetical protein
VFSMIYAFTHIRPLCLVSACDAIFLECNACCVFLLYGTALISLLRVSLSVLLCGHTLGRVL